MSPLDEEPALKGRWVAWRYAKRGGSGKPTKVPYSPRTGATAASDDPSTWGTLAQARKHEPKDGVGVMLGDLGDGTALIGFDLDSCRDPESGELESWASGIVDRFSTYTEVSPSGRGVKGFMLVDADALAGFREATGNDCNKSWGNGPDQKIELHWANRYYAVTGEALVRRVNVRKVDAADVHWIIREAGPRFAGATQGSEPKDETRSARHYRACLASHDAGRTYDEHLDSLDDELRDYADEARGRSTKGERDWERAGEHVESRRSRLEFDDLTEGEPKRARLFLTAAEIRAMPRPHDFVENLLYERCVSVWAGPAKSGKSYLILDLAHAVALGRPWAGRGVDKGAVLVLPLEGVGLLQDRIRAWELEHKATSPIIFSPTPLNLLKGPKEVAEIVDFAREHEPKLIIIDTLARAMPGANEAAFEDISRALATIDHLKDATGAHVLIVHHFGHSRKGPRGHSDILGNPDLVVEITREGALGSARVTHNRNGPDGEALRFGLKWRETDIVSSRGKRVFGGVVELSGDWFADLDAEEKEAAMNLPERQAEALEVLRRLNAEPLLGPASRDEWRDALKAAGWPKTPVQDWRGAFRDATNGLVRKGLIEVANDRVEITRGGV